ncbi:MAG: hypothetical protein WAW52_05595 [Methanothrix sp.]|jgi:hypothetical protein
MQKKDDAGKETGHIKIDAKKVKGRDIEITIISKQILRWNLKKHLPFYRGLLVPPR